MIEARDGPGEFRRSGRPPHHGGLSLAGAPRSERLDRAMQLFDPISRMRRNSRSTRMTNDDRPSQWRHVFGMRPELPGHAGERIERRVEEAHQSQDSDD